MPDPAAAARMLFAARRPGTALNNLPPEALPRDLAEAYATQDALVALLTVQSGPVAGYKVGCTNVSAREMLQLDSPFSGRCFAQEISTAPAVVDSRKLHMVGIEPEIAVRIQRDMAPGTAWTDNDAVLCVGEIMPAIEIVESRFATWPLMGILSAVADNGVHRHLILGEGVPDWSREKIERSQITLSVNGKCVSEGRATNVDGGPFAVVAWLANHLNARGLALRAGEIVTTGVMTDIFDGGPGQSISADFDLPGQVTVTVS
jgi:2-keto-4-pentenoate hydratase